MAFAAKAVCAKVARSSPMPRHTASGPYEEIDKYISKQMRRLIIPGAAIAIIEGDQIVHMRGFGSAWPNCEPPTPRTPFFIGSTTKSMTAMAVMQLIEAGKIELDAPIQRYLPWFRVADPKASAQMSVRHLLNQTSGLPTIAGLKNLFNVDNRPDATERQACSLSSLVLSRPVGAKFEYSNLNYNLLGLIIEAASGESYADYIQRHIFEPMEMSHSYTTKAAARQNGLAMGHRRWFGFSIPAPNLPIVRSYLAAGQLISCVEDMARYLGIYLNHGQYGTKQILSAEGIEELIRPEAKIHEMGRYFGHYAMGWNNQGYGEARIVSHSGSLPDFGSLIALIPEQNKGFVLLYNTNNAIAKMTFDEMPLGAAERLAGLAPSRTYFDAGPWVERGLLLIPAFLATDVAITRKSIQSWRQDPGLCPSKRKIWSRHILPPLIPNLFIASSLIPTFGKLRDFLHLYSPDFTWIARICGSFAAIWIFIRTRLMLREFRKIKQPFPRC